MSFYGKIKTLGSREALALPATVQVEEKIDGSNFSFHLDGGSVVCRSRNRVVPDDDKNFVAGIAAAAKLAPRLTEGMTYFGEFLCRPRQNVVVYERSPDHSFVLFDIQCADEALAPREIVESEAHRLGLEVAPLLFEGEMTTPDQIGRFIDEAKPLLGGGIVEGVVVKLVSDRRLRFKFITEDYAEVNKSKRFKSATETPEQSIARRYCGTARYHKAAQHLRDDGKLSGEMSDIPLILKEVSQDLERECREEIMAELYAARRKQILGAAVGGVAGWYRGQLAFGEEIADLP